MEITAKGQNGTLVFDGKFVTIQRKGFFAAASQGRGEKRIPISAISAVQFKPAGKVLRGFIAFTLSGGREKQSKLGSQVQTAWADENSIVIVGTTQSKEFQKVRDAIELAMHTPSAAPAGVDQLQQLAQLHAQGVLSDEEFAAAKAKTLGI